jgi:hypothetical protein
MFKQIIKNPYLIIFLLLVSNTLNIQRIYSEYWSENAENDMHNIELDN